MTPTVIVVAIVFLLLGLVVGSLLTRTLSPQDKKRREVEGQLRALEDEYKLYQQDVTEHFSRTADLVTNLTRSQREVHEHLAAGAMYLANADVSRQVMNAANPQLSDNRDIHTLSSAPPEPPKDYAPTVPGGVLSENYGLSDTPSRYTTSANVANDEARDDQDDPTVKVS